MYRLLPVSLLPTLLCLASLSLAASDNSPQEKVSEKCVERALLTLIKREESQLISAQHQANRDAQQAREQINAQRRIENSIKRISDKSALQPSEIRMLRHAVEDLKKQNRRDEAQAIENRIEKHESQFAARRRMLHLTPEQEKLIQTKIRLTPLATDQLAALDPQVRHIVQTQIFLKIAENPRKTGTFYMAKESFDGIPGRELKKIRFSVKAEYRVIFRVDSDDTAIIEAVGSRSNVYKRKFKNLGS